MLHLLEEALVAAHLTHSARTISAAWILISRSDHTFYTEASVGSLMQLGKCINDLLLGGGGCFSNAVDASCGIVQKKFTSITLNGRWSVQSNDDDDDKFGDYNYNDDDDDDDDDDDYDDDDDE